MFEDDVGLKTAFRDAQTEVALLDMHERWATDIWRCDPPFRLGVDAPKVVVECVQKRDDIYWPLMSEIKADKKVVTEEYEVLLASLSPLAQWENNILDNNPDIPITTTLKQKLLGGEDPFTMYPAGDAARQKYGYIFNEMPKPLSHDLETWLYYTAPGIRASVDSRKEEATRLKYMWGNSFLSKEDYYVVIRAYFNKRCFGGRSEERRVGKECPV